MTVDAIKFGAIHVVKKINEKQAENREKAAECVKELGKMAVIPGYGLFQVGKTIFTKENMEKAKGFLHTTAEKIREFDEKYPAAKYCVGVLPLVEAEKILLADAFINGDKVEKAE